MSILVVGATGATGRLVVEQLLNSGHDVKVIVRSPEKIPEALKNQNRLNVINTAILDLSDEEMMQYVNGCDAVVSCLGHTLNLKGLYGHPRKLVTEATRKICNGIESTKPKRPVKYILMNTAGNSNRDINEKISFAHRCVVGMVRFLLPPQSDNEKAADYLRTVIGKDNSMVEWVAVRPDSLVDEKIVTEYTLHASPMRSAIFNPGKTSRINVAHFMIELLTNESLWNNWKGQMPVIYNSR